MDLLLLIKDLLNYKHLIGMFLFTFIMLFPIFKDATSIIKVFRKVITAYAICILLLKYISL